MPDLDLLIRDNNFAGVMRACLDLLDELYDDKPTAFRQNVTLRGYLQSVYDAQTEPEPLPITCIAVVAYNFLKSGKSVNTIMLIPVPDLLAISSELEQKFRAYNRENMPSLHIMSNSEPKNERGGDADQPAPSGHWDGFANADMDDMVAELDRRKRESRSLLMEIGGSGKSWIDEYTPEQQKLIREGYAPEAVIPVRFRDVEPMPLAKDPSVYPHRSSEHMILMQPRMAGKHYTYENVLSGFVPAPEHESAFSQWITAALYSILKFQVIKGWYRPQKKDE